MKYSKVENYHVELPAIWSDDDPGRLIEPGVHIELTIRDNEIHLHLPYLEIKSLERAVKFHEALTKMIAKYEELQHDLPTTPAR